MEKYWEEVKHKALEGMRRVVGQEVEDNCADMKRAEAALAYAPAAARAGVTGPTGS